LRVIVAYGDAPFEDITGYFEAAQQRQTTKKTDKECEVIYALSFKGLGQN